MFIKLENKTYNILLLNNLENYFKNCTEMYYYYRKNILLYVRIFHEKTRIKIQKSETKIRMLEMVCMISPNLTKPYTVANSIYRKSTRCDSGFRFYVAFPNFIHVLLNSL